MHRLLVLALLLVACGAGVPLAEPPELDDTAEAASVVLVRGAKQPKCGAVAVGPREIVTALHCLEGAQSVQYVDRAAWRIGWAEDTATLARWDAARDLALLATGESLDTWAAPSFEPLSDGQPVCWAHHGGRRAFAWDCGIVTVANAYAQHDEGWRPKLFFDATETDLVATDGDSGSGLWDAWGRLVGVCAAVRESSGRAVFLRGDALVALLRNETERTP